MRSGIERSRLISIFFYFLNKGIAMFALAALSDKAKELLAKIIGIVICLLLVWAVISIFQAKNERIEKLNEQVTAQKAANVKLHAELEKKGRSDTATQNTLQETKRKEEKQQENETQVAAVVSQEVKEIKEKYIHLDPTPENDAKRVTEVSAARAKSLWMIYCMQEPNDTACK
jgi:ABC-type transport system involved in cytochrome bd biosynthesis fused ATPase/permease subunit